MSNHHPLHDPIMAKANDWVIRERQGNLSARQSEQFRRWRAADPRHEAAATAVEDTWRLMEGIRGNPRFSVRAQRPRLHPWALQACLLWQATGRWLAQAPTRPWRWLALAGGTAAAYALSLGLNLAYVQWSADYYNQAGVVQQIQLPDGSQVTLGSRSALYVEYSDQERRVRLARGEAVFSPEPISDKEPRTFIVEAAGASSRALGTRYAVRVDGNDSGWVGVLEHSIALSLDKPLEEVRSAATLMQGQSAYFDRQAGVRVQASDLEEHISWLDGYLIFHEQPLEQVIERINQYRPGHIALMNPALKQRSISAVLPLRSLDKPITLETLERELKAHILSAPGGLSLVY